jgi:hypothetical protein
MPGTDSLGLEEYAMVPSAPAARRNERLGSVHVSTKSTC